jgi:ribosome maturation factor RimP
MLDSKLQAIIEPAVKDMGLQFIGLEIVTGSRMVARIYIDTLDDNGVTIDQCSSVSREVASLLDVSDEIKSAYTLEVSSPGLERRLFKLADYEEYVGFKIKVKLCEPVNGKRNFVGELISVTDQVLHMKESDGKDYTINYNSVLKGNLKL